MTDAERQPARDPQDLERLLIARQHAGDIEGMVDLFEPDAVMDTGEGEPIRGVAAIRAHFEGLETEGRRFTMGIQQPALINGELALTSTRSQNGSVTAEVARRQPDGTWRWAIDQYAIA